MSDAPAFARYALWSLATDHRRRMNWPPISIHADIHQNTCVSRSTVNYSIINLETPDAISCCASSR